MGYHTISGTGHSYGLIAYGADGVERKEAASLFSRTLIGDIAAQSITDVFLFTHGWKGDIPSAIDQYDSWMGALMASADAVRAPAVFADFRPLLIGLHWPSLPWGNESARSDGSFAATAQTGADEMFAKCLANFGDRPEIRAPLHTIFEAARQDMMPDSMPDPVEQAYRALDSALGLGSLGVGAPPDADREGFDPSATYQALNEEGDDFGGFSLSGLLGPLQQLSYWNMKKRARNIGEGGMHAFLKDLQTAPARHGLRIHLMGHSFGAIVISGMLGGPNAAGRLPRPVESVTLVQGAVSLWCYAPIIPFRKAGAGYFSAVLRDGKIAGPLVTTQSRFDKAVGQLYPLASRLHGSASFETGTGAPEYGAIGTYGIQGLAESVQVDAAMQPADGAYGFRPGKVYNLESSRYICKGDGPGGAHSDIGGPEVAHAIWEAAFALAESR
jgi:hypothetical protein